MSAAPSVRDDRRGQTNVDFVIGIAIFLTVVTFVVGFLPSMTAPYGDQGNAVVADRIADDLVGTLLAGSGGPSALDEGCTVAFFENESGGPDCPFGSSAPLSDRLAVSPAQEVNVTLERTDESGTAVLCHAGDDIGPCGTDPLAVGPSVPATDRSVTAAARVVSLPDGRAVLEVRVW